GESGSSLPNLDSKVENEFSKTKNITSQNLFSVLNSIPVLKEKGSFSSISVLEFKQGPKTCVGKTNLNIIYNKELKRYLVTRTTTKTSGNCNGNILSKNYQTNRDLNLNFLYKVALSKGVIISEGSFLGKRAFMLSLKEKDQTTAYLLSVNGESFDSLKSEYNYLSDDGYIKINTTISPSAGTNIDANLIEDTPETGDIIELSEFPLYDLIG
ncbi:MAG: hypothetical protein ACHQYQ_05425, partial [Bacteriovoracales bacterium]